MLSWVTIDVDNVQRAFAQLESLILLLAGFTVLMFLASWQLGLISLVVVVIRTRSQKLFASQWENMGELNSQIEESFSGDTLTRLFSREQDMLESLDDQETQSKASL